MFIFRRTSHEREKRASPKREILPYRWYSVFDKSVEIPRNELLRIWAKFINGQEYELHAQFLGEEGWDLPPGLKRHILRIEAFQKITRPNEEYSIPLEPSKAAITLTDEDPAIETSTQEKNTTIDDKGENIKTSSSKVEASINHSEKVQNNEANNRSSDKVEDIIFTEDYSKIEEYPKPANTEIDIESTKSELETLKTDLGKIEEMINRRNEVEDNKTNNKQLDNEIWEPGMKNVSSTKQTNNSTKVCLKEMDLWENEPELAQSVSMSNQPDYNDRMYKEVLDTVEWDRGAEKPMEYITGTDEYIPKAEIQQFVTYQIHIECHFSERYKIQMFKKTGEIGLYDKEIIVINPEQVKKFSEAGREALLWIWTEYEDKPLQLFEQEEKPTLEYIEAKLIDFAKEIQEQRNRDIINAYNFLKKWNYEHEKSKLFTYVSQITHLEPIIKKYGDIYLQKLFRERKAVIEREYIEERMRWIDRYGSDYLKYLAYNQYEVEPVYAEERVRKEFPGFRINNEGKWFKKENLTVEEVHILSAFPNSILVVEMRKSPIHHDTFETETYILKKGFLGQYTIVMPMKQAIEILQGQENEHRGFEPALEPTKTTNEGLNAYLNDPHYRQTNPQHSPAEQQFMNQEAAKKNIPYL